MLLCAAFPPDGDTPPLEAVLDEERLAPYVVDWGRPGDGGVIAELDGSAIGAAWYRSFSGEAPGHGFVSEAIPELSIAVIPELRGRGVGRALLIELIEHARSQNLPALSLSVSARNPAAVRLYQSLGFRTTAGDADHPTMVLELLPGAAPRQLD